MALLVVVSGMGEASSTMISLVIFVLLGLMRLTGLVFGCFFLVGVTHSHGCMVGGGEPAVAAQEYENLAFCCAVGHCGGRSFGAEGPACGVAGGRIGRAVGRACRQESDKLGHGRGQICLK